MDFIDLKVQYQKLKSEIDTGISTVINNAQFIGGPQVKELEEKLAEYVGVKHCITCANGTDALTLSLMAYGIGKGDAVFVPTFTFYASAETVSLCGATPVFVDIDPTTFNISAEDLEKAVKEVEEGKIRAENGQKLKLRAVVAVDLFGLPADFNKINKLAEEHNLLVIEDGAQGFGGSIDGKKACSFGDISITSFFPAKPLGCYGDGGAVFTNEDKVKDYLSSLKVHGKGADKYDNVRVGMNSRLDNLQAAILLPKLRAFKEYELDSRNRISKLYCQELGDKVVTPYIPDGYVSSYAQFSILLKDNQNRDKVEQNLKASGIPTMIYYKKSMHQQTVYTNNPSIYRRFANAENISERILNLPMHPYLENQVIAMISKIVVQEKKAVK